MTRLALAAMLAASLSGCVDATVDVALTSQTTAKASTTQVMGADFYALVKMNDARKDDDPRKRAQFCQTGNLTETADGGATCSIAEEGRFSQLTLGVKDQMLKFSRVTPGKVRVSLPLDVLKTGLGPSDDAQSTAVLEAFFAGHTLTVRFSGGAVSSTNMTLGPDGVSAEQVVQFSDLLEGTGDLPDELYAIIAAPVR